LTTVAIRQHYLPKRFLMTPAQRDITYKLRIFNYVKQIGNVSAACRHYGISCEFYCRWKRAYEKDGEQAPVNSKPCPENPKLRTKPEVEEKILHFRLTYLFSQQRIAWYLERHHDITISASGVRGVLSATV
jgi:transposase